MTTDLFWNQLDGVDEQQKELKHLTVSGAHSYVLLGS